MSIQGTSGIRPKIQKNTTPPAPTMTQGSAQRTEQSTEQRTQQTSSTARTQEARSTDSQSQDLYNRTSAADPQAVGGAQTLQETTPVTSNRVNGRPRSGLGGGNAASTASGQASGVAKNPGTTDPAREADRNQVAESIADQLARPEAEGGLDPNAADNSVLRDWRGAEARNACEGALRNVDSSGWSPHVSAPTGSNTAQAGAALRRLDPSDAEAVADRAASRYCDRMNIRDGDRRESVRQNFRDGLVDGLRNRTRDNFRPTQPLTDSTNEQQWLRTQNRAIDQRYGRQPSVTAVGDNSVGGMQRSRLQDAADMRRWMNSLPQDREALRAHFDNEAMNARGPGTVAGSQDPEAATRFVEELRQQVRDNGGDYYQTYMQQRPETQQVILGYGGHAP